MVYHGNNCSAIGGYLGIELPKNAPPFKTAMKFQSARSSLRFWLENNEISTLNLPIFICDSIVKAVEESGVEIKFYNLRKDFLPDVQTYINDKNTGYLLVNYFGLKGRELSRLQKSSIQTNFCLDNSQAFFAPPISVGAAIYSPRKFFGLPDGGLLQCYDHRIEREYVKLEQDTASILRMNHLLKRVSQGARAGYSDFLQAEASLEETKPRKMSDLTARLLQSVDISKAATARQNNFDYLNNVFGEMNSFHWQRMGTDTPLCYPLMLNQDVGDIKAKLAEKDIFCATYWPEVLQRVSTGSWEADLVTKTLHLPCDQRYSIEHMKTMTDTVLKVLKSGQ